METPGGRGGRRRPRCLGASGVGGCGVCVAERDGEGRGVAGCPSGEQCGLRRMKPICDNHLFIGSEHALQGTARALHQVQALEEHTDTEQDADAEQRQHRGGLRHR